MTPSEKFVADLSRKSFLPFWSFANPVGKKGKELCDVFVVCEHNIIIFSVKDISLSRNANELIQYDRWIKKAVYASAEQIYGAERFLESVIEVYSKEKNIIKLPDKENRIMHRIAIAFGKEKNYPIPNGNFGKGFVHVFDEESTFLLLNELDTITDFTNYLIAKEKFVADKRILLSTESDFLAFYLQTGLEVDYPADLINLDNGIWKTYVKSEEYLKWQKDILLSYVWDDMISYVYMHHVNDAINDERRSELELSVRKINLEPRINRIELGSILKDAIERKVSARMLKPLQGCSHTYVFMPLSNKNWKSKESELKLRCVVARVENPNTETIIGISIGRNSKDETHFDICYLHVPELDENFIKHASKIQMEFEFFKNPKISHSKSFRN